MKIRWLVVLFVVGGCMEHGSAVEPMVDAEAPHLCMDLELATIAEPNVGEVRVLGLITTPGNHYTAADNQSTWSEWVRRKDNVLGTYGANPFAPGPLCQWYDAAQSRTPATGVP